MKTYQLNFISQKSNNKGVKLKNIVQLWITLLCFSYRTPLMLAIENGHVDTVLYLIANGAIVNARDIQGRTALHRGVSN
jgi:hypothetical protein